MIPPQVECRCAADSRRLARIDGLCRQAEDRAAARFYFNENVRLVIDRDQVDFGAGDAEITLQNTIPASPQMPRCSFLAALPQRETPTPRQFFVPPIEAVAEAHPAAPHPRRYRFADSPAIRAHPADSSAIVSFSVNSLTEADEPSPNPQRATTAD
jgi:hypothetical protein